MVRIERDGDLAKVVANTKSGKTITITWKKTGPDGTFVGHSSNMAFFEKSDGTLKSTSYVLGLTEGRTRRFVATPKQLKQAFKQAGLDEPQIVRRKEPFSGRSLRAMVTAVLGTPSRIIAARQTIR